MENRSFILKDLFVMKIICHLLLMIQRVQKIKKRRRDIVVKTDINGVYCLLSIEHQSTIDKNMVMRYGNYEMMEYLKQLKNKKNKRLGPQFTIVFYTEPKKWKGPLTLSDYLDIPEELKKYSNDWKIILVDVKVLNRRFNTPHNRKLY